MWDHDWHSFRVKACNDAFVALMQTPGNRSSNLYEVVLGGWSNQKSAIRLLKYGVNTVIVDTPNILNCTQWRRFWVSWKDGVIDVGYGPRAGVRKFMSWRDPEYFGVNGLNVASAHGSTAVWHFSEPKGM